MKSLPGEKGIGKEICFLGAIIIFLMLMIVRPVKIFAAEEDYEYSYSEDYSGYLITAYKGSDTKLILPETYAGEKVVGIGNNAFASTAVVEIEIPDSYVIIEHEAFKKCTALEQVTIGASVAEIEYDAFYGASALKTLILDTSSVKITQNDFRGCGIETLIFSDEATAIGITGYTLSELTKLKELVIGNNITEIPSSKFQECEKLEKVTFGNSVKTIKSHAFYNCPALTTVIMGYSVETIERCAFADCISIREFSLGKGVQILGDQVFSGCTNLKTLTINSPYAAGSFCFDEVELDKLIISDTTTAFPTTGCPSAKEIIIGAFITEIPAGTFKDCSTIETVSFPAGLKKIGGNAFKGCSSLKELNFPEGLEEIGDYAFYQCTSLETVVLPDSLKVLGKQSFSGAGVKTLTIGKGVSEVGSSVLEGCDNLYQLIVEGKDTIIDGIFGATGDEAQKKVTIVAPQDSLAAEAALANNFRCTDSTEVSIQCRTTTMYVTETRIMELYNDEGSAKWATTDEGILSVDEYGFITANAVYDHDEQCSSRYNMNGILYELEESGIT